MQVNGYRYTPNEIWDPLLYASASSRSIRYACMNLKRSPSYSLVNTYLKGMLGGLTLDEIETKCNDMITSTLPPRLNLHPQKVAIDLVLIPYYGDEKTKEIRRSEPPTVTIGGQRNSSAMLQRMS